MVNLLVVKGFENGNQNFTNLHVFKADKIVRNGGQFSMLALCILINRSEHLVFYQVLSSCFSCLTAKVNRVSSFKFTMVSFF